MTLDEQMDFDHVVRVHPDGTVTDTDIWAPCLYDGVLDQRSGDTYDWSLMDGYSGQDRYSGPIMHASEFIGGGMERDILATPGLYVCLIDYPLDDSEPEGWAVAYKRE